MKNEKGRQTGKTEKTELIVAAAADVFMRYGFKRVTMSDLAEAAQMSRPALYLEFASKEQVFIAVIEQLSRKNLEEIRVRLTHLKNLEEKLELAFEVWFVRPFQLILSSPDAADLFESVKEFAAGAICETATEFEDLLVEILESSPQKSKTLKLTSRQIARLMRTAAKGFKMEAKSAEELRKLIRDMRRLVLMNY